MYGGLSRYSDREGAGKGSHAVSQRLLGMCLKECPVGAIGFFLGADIGGNGSVMTVTKDGQILHWNIHKSNGREVTIDVDRRSSNKY